MTLLGVFVVPATNPGYHPDKVLEHGKRTYEKKPSLVHRIKFVNIYCLILHTSNDEEYRDIRLRRTLVEVDGPDDDHADGDDNGDGARDGAADRAEEEDENLDQEVDEVSRRFVRVSNATKQGVVGRRGCCKKNIKRRKTKKKLTSY